MLKASCLILSYSDTDVDCFCSFFLIYLHWTYDQAIGIQSLLSENMPPQLLVCFFLLHIFYLFLYYLYYMFVYIHLFHIRYVTLLHMIE
jgi:hypothetical protein